MWLAFSSQVIGCGTLRSYLTYCLLTFLMVDIAVVDDIYKLADTRCLVYY